MNYSPDFTKMPKKKIKKAKRIKAKKVSKKKKFSALAKNEIKEPVPKQEEIELKRTKIRVIGVGGGGGSIVSEIASKVKKASFVAANTDSQALKFMNKSVIKFQFGEAFTKGLGTGMNPEIGEMAAWAEKDRIKKLFEGYDLCIIISSLGNGTGSGAAPVFAKIANSLGILTYGIFTLPFNFEGDKKMIFARDSLEKLKSRVNALSVIPNERIFQIIDKNTPLKQALSEINQRLAASIEGLIEIIFEMGLINIDFADFGAVLQGQGRLTYLNSIDLDKKEGVAPEVAQKLLNSPLYPYGIKGARGVLYNIAGDKELTISEVSQISKAISELVNPEAKIIFGISQNQKYTGKIKTTLLATGCSTKIFLGETSEKEKKPQPAAKKVKRLKKIQKPRKPRKTKIKKSKRKSKNTKSKSAPRKTKIKVVEQADPEIPKTNLPFVSEEERMVARIRKNALQVKKEADAAEAAMLAQEKAWEIPAFLRRKRII